MVPDYRYNNPLGDHKANFLNVGEAVSEDQSLIRYMPFPAFIYLLRNGLWFSSLLSLEDKREGEDDGTVFSLVNALVSVRAKQQGVEEFPLLNKDLIRSGTCVNCWYGRGENVGMWKLYGSAFGVAVVTTVRRLREALKTNSFTIYMGNVRYSDVIPQDPYDATFRKGVEWDHEREFRVMLMHSSPEVRGVGLSLEVHLPTLVNDLLVSPMARPWFERLVRSEAIVCGIPESAIKYSCLYGTLR